MQYSRSAKENCWRWDSALGAWMLYSPGWSSYSLCSDPSYTLLKTAKRQPSSWPDWKWYPWMWLLWASVVGHNSLDPVNSLLMCVYCSNIMRYFWRSAVPTNQDKMQSPYFEVVYCTKPRKMRGWRGQQCKQGHAACEKQHKGLNLRLLGQVFFADTTFSQLLPLERQLFTKAVACTAKAAHSLYVLEQLPAFE